MFDFGEAVRQAAALVCGFDASLVAIIALSLQVSLSAVAVAVLLGLPVGAAPRSDASRGGTQSPFS
jgi:tungstate transport system permease protein